MAVAASVAVGIPLAACGSGHETGTINIYTNADAGAITKTASAACTKESGGKYKLKVHILPKAADDQRLQLARRLAGNDSGLDLMGLDVVWTAEFANAGWVEPVPDELAAKVQQTTLGGPLSSALWKTDDDSEKRLYAIPAWSNTQLLWYRPDLMKQYLGTTKAPTTWDEMLEATEKIRKAGGPSWIMEQGAQYEGLMVWFNSVLISAGGSVVDPDDATKQTLNDTPEHRAATLKALQILKSVATAPGHDPSITNADETAGRLGMESGKAAFQINWPFVFASMRSNAAAGDVPFFKEMTKYSSLLTSEPEDSALGEVNDLVRTKFEFAPYPGVSAGTPARSTIGGLNIGVASTSKQKALAFEAAECLTTPASQKIYAIDGGNPPVLKSLYDDKDFKAAYPMGDIIGEQLAAGRAATRPASPVYQSISTLVTATLSPVGSWDPESMVDKLADQVQKAIDGKGLIP
ncbi:extracellular solute-binding protein [Gordonia amarae]|uniref:Extracellular solute-binding protein n=1 Tax=Gordonia amarae TaxID=36821 RepID=A0A857KRQ2_9ACTN|nr:ABC transporter substrate-binding protein [Gordonia amarae]QHN19795.1 extracellular solute-binding protein [Gordonia amarae]QHN24256.1 extracellular solute-binding protein [Gordonia amarae]QHN33176.1 extracellular solute-binding protein [Gordonia amarae]QHN41898.1 extracellular solute-binding protein [Gordonia amarae]